MKTNIYPKDYASILDLKQTEKAIKIIKDFFQQSLASELKLRRVTAPLFVKKGTGINDDLNGVEKPVSFSVKNIGNAEVEIVQSLAKWKRMMLSDYGIEEGYGLYTDMNAIRPDEIPDNLHSLYVDQWDWEKVMSPSDRKLDYLKQTVRKIYNAIKRTEYIIYETFPGITPVLPDQIEFIQSEDLLEMYPGLSPKERENKVAQKYGAVFVIGIGAGLKDGMPHDLRAPDYDDWISVTGEGSKGLNGDIILWNPLLECAFEISSMGIRVNRQSLSEQLKIRDQEWKKELLFHSRLLKEELPQSIGGGIGQSRLCMYLLRKAHIGEVQASLWPDEMILECRENNIILI